MKICLNHVSMKSIAAEVRLETHTLLTLHAGLLERSGQVLFAPFHHGVKHPRIDLQARPAAHIVLSQRGVEQPRQQPERLFGNRVDEQRTREMTHRGRVA